MGVSMTEPPNGRSKSITTCGSSEQLPAKICQTCRNNTDFPKVIANYKAGKREPVRRRSVKSTKLRPDYIEWPPKRRRYSGNVGTLAALVDSTGERAPVCQS